VKITIGAIGKLKEKYLREGCAEYIKRLKPYCRLYVVEHPEEKLTDESAVARMFTMDREGERLTGQLKRGDFVIALDVVGRRLSSPDLAALLAQKALQSENSLVFLLGGAYGLSDKAKTASNLLLSLSDLTFTHQLARLFLLEQLYRSFKINNREKYHN
jgi:23S rRNA (pseudouridine1915-N3)-methyltransferase